MYICHLVSRKYENMTQVKVAASQNTGLGIPIGYVCVIYPYIN